MIVTLDKHPVFGAHNDEVAAKLAEVSAEQMLDAFNLMADPAIPTPETHNRAVRFEINRRIGRGDDGPSAP